MVPPIFPSRDEFMATARSANLIPVHTELLADVETPMSAYIKLRENSPSFLLESVEQGERFARYSFVGCDPAVIFSSRDQQITVREKGQTTTLPIEGDPLGSLERFMSRYRPAPTPPDFPLFYGGAVGFLAYEAVRFFEPTVPLARTDDLGVPDAYYMVTNVLLAFDHLKRRVKIIANAYVEGDAGAAYDLAVATIHRVLNQLDTPHTAPKFTPYLHAPELTPEANMTHESYLKMTAAMQEFIGAGDIFQVVPSQRFEVPFPASPVELYRALRSVNPSPYMFLLELEEMALVGSSPEVHVRCEEGRIGVRPIAGTRPRRADPEEDAAMEKELLADAKERAEHLMLVDLARNDVGRVCEFHSVRVPEFMVVERYSHVMHIVSHVEGKLRPDNNMYDVMRATFPAGTVSGSPKVRAMQIIAAGEPTRRGVYAGAVGYFSFSGNLDSCIAIRTVLLKNKRAYLQAGGGLVADSTPEGEYQESVNKARAGMRALALACAHHPSTP
jgi:anthranilate synthase component 1